MKKHIRKVVNAYRRIFNMLLIKISPEFYVMVNYKKRFKENINLNNPKTFAEKIQWLKLNFHDEKIVLCADKYKVREYVKALIGEEFLIDMPFVWNSYKEVDFDVLPQAFVLKPNNSSGRVLICKRKEDLNISKAIKTMKKWEKEDLGKFTGEWMYREIPYKLVCEKFLQNDITDYKFYFADGEFICVQTISDRGRQKKFCYYDENWNLLNIKRCGVEMGERIDKPEKYGEMLEVAKRLAQGFIFVRVDLYYVKDRIYFGELSFYPNNGFIKYETKEMDEFFSEKITLPKN